MASKTIPVKNQEKDPQKSQIPRALSLIKRGNSYLYLNFNCVEDSKQDLSYTGMAFMKRNSPLRSNQLRRTSSDSGPPVRPKKWADLDHQQSSVQIRSEQNNSKSPKPSKTPNKLVKLVGNSKKPLTRPSPYSYCAKKVSA